ncbi:MASE1 domain-containing protein [Nitrospina gracilis]|uniref:MASE1 domain-containing protein n=1 Tax=Nitrospina gracilis TaxID=35801 RepID=UPI001F31AA13|nr:MASE1 domain-containing protein [Nitrospina gracilis]MCF8719525.1 PAS domain S-box-containing protein [Nitrospina gracilis Nb-211]
MKAPRTQGIRRNLGRNLLTALLYFLCGFGMVRLANVYGYSIPLFAPAGFALGAYLCWGPRILPGIWLGSLTFTMFLWSSMAAVPGFTLLGFFPVATFIALGAVIQTATGALLLRYGVGSINPLTRIQDVLIFIFGVGALNSTIHSTLAQTSLLLGGFLQPDQFASAWMTWWLGDAMGILTVTPLFMVYLSTGPIRLTRSQALEATALAFFFYFTTQMAFGDWLIYWHYPLVYLLFPVLVWSAFRFRQAGAVIAILLVSLAAIWGTAQGRGPMALQTVESSLRLLQFYLLVLTIMTLILTAAISETEAAEQRTSSLGRILENSSNEIFVFDAKTLRFLQVNLGARQNLGYSMKELAQLTPLDLKPHFTREKFFKMLEPLQGELQQIVFETHHRRKDGSTYPVEMRIQYSEMASRPVYFAIVQDITEKKKAEEELFKYRHNLEELVEQRTADLESAHRQLMHAEKLSATGKLAASMAHEFNNPIFGIRSVLEKVFRRGNLQEKDRDFVSLAIKECDRISNLIKKLLNFHSPSSDKKEVFNFHEAVEDMVFLIKKKLKEKNIDLVRSYSSDVKNIEAVPDQIRQVILNILQNAEEAITEPHGSIGIRTSLEKSNIHLEITDTGQGISPGTMKNIFDPFFTTKPLVKGTGLGLSVSYGIVKMHGGDIRVDSKPGQGTRFTVILPVKARNLHIDILQNPALLSFNQKEPDSTPPHS